jgi:TrpR-related protein YerC/YecD
VLARYYNGTLMTKLASPSRVFDLPDALLALRSRAEAEAFLTDLCTPAEVRALSERWRVAQMLDAGGLSYREIAEQEGTSTTTVTRVARFLREMPFNGYRKVLDRLKAARR